MLRGEIASHISRRLTEALPALADQYAGSSPGIGHFVIDDLLPVEIAKRIHAAFPDVHAMHLNKSLREYKYIAAQMDRHEPLVEEAIYAFQDRRVVELIGRICGIEELLPDEYLYAGGISVMGKGNYLNPHLDNSHDKDRKLWRVLNLLYYISPDWAVDYGGNLELWVNGPRGEPLTIASKFNRLAVMATHQGSWHSVSPVKVDAYRCCVSNYYFSPEPLRGSDEFHVTSFRGRPEQPLRDVVLRTDAVARMMVRKLFRHGIVETGHIYKKSPAETKKDRC